MAQTTGPALEKESRPFFVAIKLRKRAKAATDFGGCKVGADIHQKKAAPIPAGIGASWVANLRG